MTPHLVAMTHEAMHQAKRHIQETGESSVFSFNGQLFERMQAWVEHLVRTCCSHKHTNDECGRSFRILLANHVHCIESLRLGIADMRAKGDSGHEMARKEGACPHCREPHLGEHGKCRSKLCTDDAAQLVLTSAELHELTPRLKQSMKNHADKKKTGEDERLLAAKRRKEEQNKSRKDHLKTMRRAPGRTKRSKKRRAMHVDD